MLSYKPLYHTLVDRGLTIADLEVKKGGPLNARTVSKLRHDYSMNLESIVKICVFLNAPIEEVVEVTLGSAREDQRSPQEHR